jgi:hypothetical protein
VLVVRGTNDDRPTVVNASTTPEEEEEVNANAAIQRIDTVDNTPMIEKDCFILLILVGSLNRNDDEMVIQQDIL